MENASDQEIRSRINANLAAAGWVVQAGDLQDPSSAYGVAVAKYPLAFSPAHGENDYLLYLNGSVRGVVKFAHKLPVIPEYLPLEESVSNERLADLGPARELPESDPIHWFAEKAAAEDAVLENDRDQQAKSFYYMTDGHSVQFSDWREIQPRPRKVAGFHRPVALASWLAGEAVPQGSAVSKPTLLKLKQPTPAPAFVTQLEHLPPLPDRALWSGQRTVLTALETTLRRGERRIWAHMAGGSGKTHTLLVLASRLIEYAKRHRILMITDSDPLAWQTLNEFRELQPEQIASSPGTTPLPSDIAEEIAMPPAQHLCSSQLDTKAKLIICSPQRLLALASKAEGVPLSPAVNHSLFHEWAGRVLMAQATASGAGAGGTLAHGFGGDSNLPQEFFDCILIDDPSPAIAEFLASILNHFDAPAVAVTSVPCKEFLHTFGLHPVAEYPYEQAISDGVIVPYSTYQIKVAQGDSDDRIEAEAGPLRIAIEPCTRHRAATWITVANALEPEESSAAAGDDASLDTDATDYTILQTFRDRLAVDIFPGRVHVPKTLLVARSGTHADGLVTLAREVFGAPEKFCHRLDEDANSGADYTDTVFHPRPKKVRGRRPKINVGEPQTPNPDSEFPYLNLFRSSEEPRIGVVPANSFVMAADLRAVEIILIMAPINSRGLLESLKSRALRTVRRAEYQRLNPATENYAGKSHAVIIDTAGSLADQRLNETWPLDRLPSQPLAQLLQDVAFGSTSPDTLRSLAARLLKLDTHLSPADKDTVARLAGGATLHTLATRLLSALDTDRQVTNAARAIRDGSAPTAKMVEQAAVAMLGQAAVRMQTSPELRNRLMQLDRQWMPQPPVPAAGQDGDEEVDLSQEETLR